MAKTGLINSEWEGQFANEVANFKTRDTERQSMEGTGKKRKKPSKIYPIFLTKQLQTKIMLPS